MRLALDTNVISELTRADCDQNVAAWIAGVDSQSLCLPAPCWAELQRGLCLLPHGHRRESLTRNLADLVNGMGGGILPFGRLEAEAYALLSTESGRPTIDSMIAAICQTHQVPLATRNIRDFTGCGIGLINPWQNPPARSAANPGRC